MSEELERNVMHTSTDERTRQWSLILHLSQFAGYLVPGLGFIAPILIWQIKKAELPGLDPHGRAVTNWMISLIIYLGAAFLLAFVLIGMPLLVILGILGVVFPIVGALKASNGQVWKYPLAIPFF
jgi:hypothetical protein